MKRFIKTLVSAITLIALAISLFAGCGKRGNQNGGSNYNYDYSVSDEKITYTFFGAYGSFAKNDSDKVWKTVEDKFNVKIKLVNGGDNWRQSLNTKVGANRNVPDVFFTIPDENAFPSWVSKGYIVPLNGYLDKIEEQNGSSALKNMFESRQFKNSTTIGGVNYFAPMVTGASNHVMLVRKDWMKKWAKAEKGNEDFIPETLSDFTAMLTYFHVNDLGGKGTYGLGLNDNFDFVEDLLSIFGVSPSFTKNSDGSYTLSALTDGYDKFLDWLREGQKTGYIYPDFDSQTEKKTKENLESGKIGAMMTTSCYTFTNEIATFEHIVKKNGDAELDILNLPSSDDGKYVGSPVGDQYYWGGYCVSVNAKEPMRLVSLLDYIYSEEGQALFTYGAKDEYYTETDGVKTVTEDNITKRYSDGAGLFVAPDPYEDKNVYGRYDLGTKLFPMNFTVENGNIVCNNAYELYYDKGSYQRRADERIADLEKNGNLNFRQPTFLVDKADMTEKMIKILDYAKTYTTTATRASVSSADVQKAKNKMLSDSKSKGLDSLLKYLQENGAKE